jgi:replicative DNA helicase
LRDSGQIEEAADVVLFIHRPEAYSTDNEQEGKAEIIIAKGRNYGTGKFEVAFEKEYTRFADYADRVGGRNAGAFAEVAEPF